MNGHKDSFLKNLTSNGYASIISVASPILIMLIVSKNLGVEEYGRYAASLSYAWIYIVFSEFGVTMALMHRVSENEISKEKIEQLISCFIFLRCAQAIFLLPFYTYFFMRYFGSNYLVLCLTFLLYMGSSLNLTWFFQGKEIARALLKDSMISKSLLIFAACLGFVLNSPVEYYIGIQSLSVLLMFALGIGRVKRSRYIVKPKLDVKLLQDLIKDSFAFYSSRLVVSLYENSSTFFVSRYLSDSDTGRYAVFLQLYKGGTAVLGVFPISLLPYVNRTKNYRILSATVLILTSLMLIFAPLASTLFSIVFGLLLDSSIEVANNEAKVWYLSLIFFCMASVLGYPYFIAISKIALGHLSMLIGSAVYLLLVSFYYATESVNTYTMAMAIAFSISTTALIRLFAFIWIEHIRVK